MVRTIIARGVAVTGAAMAAITGTAVAASASQPDRPARTTTNSRRRTMTAARPLPHTIQLCIRCRQNPAGFWVSRNSDQTVRRPWCLSCCQDLDLACHHIKPFDLLYLR